MRVGSNGVGVLIRIGSICSGIGGFELGLEYSLPNAGTIWQIEIDPYCRSVLAQHWPNTERFEDVKTIGVHELQPVEICCFGWPCQDHSNAGSRLGLAGKNSGLWYDVHRLAFCELRPPIVVMEQVPAIAAAGRGLADVLGSVAACGYHVRWDVVSCAAVGSVHRRDRLFFICWRDLTDSDRGRFEIVGIKKHKNFQSETGDQSNGLGHERSGEGTNELERYRTKKILEPFPWKKISGSICPVDDGIPGRVAMLKALGNSISPQVAAVVGLKVGQVLEEFLNGRDPARVLGF